MPSRILLGHIAGAHGIRGEVLIKSYTGVAEDIAAYGLLTDESGARAFEVESARATPKGVVARIGGVTDRTAAEALKGVGLWAERSRLPPTEPGEYYHSDLIGLRAVTPEGKTLGEVVAVQNYGAGDLLEIRIEGTRRTELIPFTDAFVPEVDVAAGSAVVMMPPETESDRDDAAADQTR
jgi:16S rRNA processing protein RimM